MTQQLQPYQLTSCLVEFGSVWWASTVAVRISTICNSQCRYCCSQRLSSSRCRGWCIWHIHSWPTCNHGQGQETLWARQCREIPVFHVQKVRGMSWKNHINVQKTRWQFWDQTERESTAGVRWCLILQPPSITGMFLTYCRPQYCRAFQSKQVEVCSLWKSRISF